MAVKLDLDTEYNKKYGKGVVKDPEHEIRKNRDTILKIFAIGLFAIVAGILLLFGFTFTMSLKNLFSHIPPDKLTAEFISQGINEILKSNIEIITTAGAAMFTPLIPVLTFMIGKLWKDKESVEAKSKSEDLG